MPCPGATRSDRPPSSGGGRRGGRARSLALAILLAAAAGGTAGCSKKLSSGGGAMDSLFYDVLKMDRGTQYYYGIVRDAHERKDFSYRYGDDPYIADKCVDAIVHLGDAKYDRIEGEAQVILLLSDVLIEDASALARATAARALTKLGLKLVPPPGTPVPDVGSRYLALLQRLDGLHDLEGRRRPDTPETKAAVARTIDEIGLLEFDESDIVTTKNGLILFTNTEGKDGKPSRRYIVNETDPALRDVIDRAIVRRAAAVVRAYLSRAVADERPLVRVDAVDGLRELRDARAMDAVVAQAEQESQPRVRMAMAEYFGAIGGRQGAEALVTLVGDADGSVRHKARAALTSLAGRDLGAEPAAWGEWRKTRYPDAGSTADGAGGAPVAPGEDSRRSRARAVGGGSPSAPAGGPR